MAAAGRPTRGQLLDDPRSGARPLAGSPGRGEDRGGQGEPGNRARNARVRAAARARNRRQRQAGNVTGQPAAGPAPARAPAPLSAPQKPAAAPAQPTAAAPAAQPPQDRQSALAARFRGRGVAGEGAGAVLALFAYPLLVNGLRGGPAQAKGWLAAKFINQPYGGGRAGGGRAPSGSGAPPPAPRRPGTGPQP